MDQRTFPYRNHLLRTLDPEDLDALIPRLAHFSYSASELFERPDEPLARVCFPETGLISILASGSHGHRLEIGLVGFEGMTGISAILGDDSSSEEVLGQVGGDGHWICPVHLREAMAARPSLAQRLLAYVRAFGIQVTGTAISGGFMKVDERLARWLLMAHDRLQNNDLPLTHDLLSLMLGIRRAGVTEALHVLEGNGVIKARRRVITIKDRPSLVALASTCYGRPEKAYRRLLGDPFG
jgi:CRP-like cAMP-binding protein